MLFSAAGGAACDFPSPGNLPVGEGSREQLFPGPLLESKGRAASAASGKDLSTNKCINMTSSYILLRDGQKQKLFTWLLVAASSSHKTDGLAKHVAITTPLSCPHIKGSGPLGLGPTA